MSLVNKKQVYIWPENLEFFNSLPNKSRTINLLIKKYQEEVEDERTGEANA